MKLCITMASVAALWAVDAVPTRAVLANETEWAETVSLAKLLAETDAASAAATDFLLERKPDESKIGCFFALLIKDNWYVYFGKLSAQKDNYLPGYVLSAPRRRLKEIRIIKLEDAPRIGPAYARAVAASAMNAAQETANPGVNPILVPQPSGELDVYVVQGSKEQGVVLLGGDWHDRWDASGAKLLSREQFHKSVIPQRDSDTPADAVVVGSYHTHILIEGPSATDVMSVLQNPMIAPMFVLGKSGAIYRVDRDGSVHTEDRAQLKAQGIEFPEPELRK